MSPTEAGRIIDSLAVNVIGVEQCRCLENKVAFVANTRKVRNRPLFVAVTQSHQLNAILPP